MTKQGAVNSGFMIRMQPHAPRKGDPAFLKRLLASDGDGLNRMDSVARPAMEEVAEMEGTMRPGALKLSVVCSAGRSVFASLPPGAVHS